uniref:Basic helix-loop-helix transcription factor n=1 Tax=Salvia miltiorrhiza TaxID=226208 RepID=A0A0H3Y7G8_SALMI|nr:basic helix-loop-helix transcription factor [Salvia miltiorrhiza]
MYEENNGFDESSSMHGGGFSEAEDAFSQTHCNNFTTQEQPYPQNDVAALEMELQIEQCFTNNNKIHEMVHQASHWQDITTGHYQNSAADFNQVFAAKASFTHPPDLPTIFPPPSSLLPNFPQKSPAFSASSSSIVYDPLLALNQPPSFRDLFYSSPNGGGVYTLGVGVDEREANVGFYENGEGVFEFTAAEMVEIENGDGIKDTKQHSSEKRRRVELKGKYESLRLLVPDPSKNDRASIVADAIRYIKELKRTVGELKGLVERKRCARERFKRPKVEEDDVDPSLRSSWLHRKSKNTEVDVRIVDDEITVKLVQQKRINCLLFVSKVHDELQLDLQHVAGGLIGDYYSYLFNSKICEGSIVYASAVANKLIEVADKHYAALPPTTY